jgi:hypothetical protein
MIHAYLGYNIIAIEEPMATESPIKEMSEWVLLDLVIIRI